MKKKVLSVILTLGMMMCMVGCGAKNPAAIIIEGNSYDLSGDFQEVVGTMVEDGLQVANYYMSLTDKYVFDEDGKMLQSDKFDMEEPYIRAVERMISTIPENDEQGVFVNKIYFIGANVEFESKLGFSSESGDEKIEDLDEFIESSPILNNNSDTYVALYVDGKKVDFSEYEELFDEFKDEFDGVASFKDIMDEFFPKSHYYPQLVCRLLQADYVKMTRDYDDLEEMTKRIGVPLEEEILLAFAMQDACEQLENGEAESVVVVKVEITEDEEILMEYNEFYFDEDWDPDKFMK